MLSLRQLDSIVHSNLRSFKDLSVENRREEGTYIFYDVYDYPESKERLIGTFQVWEWHDGSGRSGWVSQEELDPAVEKIRKMIWDSIMAIAVPADQSIEPEQGALIKPEKPNDKVKRTIKDYLNADKKFIYLGELLFNAAKDIEKLSSSLGVLPARESLSPSENNSRLLMSYAFIIASQWNKDDPEKNTEFIKSGWLDVFLPNFAKEFLKQFPTLSAAINKFNRKFLISEFRPQDTQATIDQILSMTLDEANMLVKAKPLLEHWKNDIASVYKEKDKPLKQVKPKQQGRYRLTKDEIKRRKKIVKEANLIYKSSDPKKTWKQIAYELDIPERTLRDWRHNPIYS